MENAGRNLLQDELGIADYDGVARVGTALVAHDEVGPLGQHVDQLAFPFVAPLGPHHDHAVGLADRTWILRREANKKAPHGATASSGKT